ncbi:hypothetical protein OBBRIDRAFT_765335 [Obba rivulosa]|uniref:GYF domain-containing protein n=1 Tax=Obba rivulosa TaxID=1052685 RepID=A0A8E2DVR3_9APHY|nr:hypothetical protein OBBRIDRAFT_765335 [Obba rivulosa]
MSSHPAGLSFDSIDVNLASSSSPPPGQDDQWSDAHYTVETDDERDIVEEVSPSGQEDLTVRGDKISPSDKSMHIETPSPTAVASDSPSQAPEEDATSVHSMPVVHVTEPSSPGMPMTAHSASSTFPDASNSNLAPPSASSARRRNRTILDNRPSNRISGFFSSLIHRRDHPPAVPEASAPSSPRRESSSRASSPIPSRASTPPPRLPPPSLNELGLSLTSLTTHMSPSHISTPPMSGTFLGPHYLLLCHSQGLDVLPLISPPTLQPYALIRRVPFKHVVVMEHRGVLVAIAGRRDGVRIYALEEIKRAVEWRMDVEIRRERERARREEAKRLATSAVLADDGNKRGSSTNRQMQEIAPETPVSTTGKFSMGRRSSISAGQPSPITGRPRAPTTKKNKSPMQPPTYPPAVPPTGPPPAYSSSPPIRDTPTAPVAQNRSRATSLSEVLAGTLGRRHVSPLERTLQDDDTKNDWASSDDEAINVVAAPSGSQALDERTSSMGAAAAVTSSPTSSNRFDMPRSQTAPTVPTESLRSRRPSNLDLTLTRTNTVTRVAPVPPPSPTPTLLNLRQSLTLSPTPLSLLPRTNLHPTGDPVSPDPEADVDADADEDEDGEVNPSSPTTPTRERISLAEALFESRLPELPPVGTRRPQQPILIGSTSEASDDPPASPRTSESHSIMTRGSIGEQSGRRRRRWSVLEGILSTSSGRSQRSVPSVAEDDRLPQEPPTMDAGVAEMRERSLSQLTRSRSNHTTPTVADEITHAQLSARQSTSSGPPLPTPVPDVGPAPPRPSSSGSTHSRFLSRIITNAFHSRKSDDIPPLPGTADADSRKSMTAPIPPHAPAPKLEYWKLPGTKGAVLVKAVETSKKSFLAILCGENGEKVELFAGTYRTALGLSRTFILPDSPRSLELQLQGDDLVEVFLVFSQNVFGLEPATVRVREVRIGRAERRAARRRARENRDQQNPEAEGDGGAPEEDTAVSVTIGVVGPPSPTATTNEDATTAAIPTPPAAYAAESSQAQHEGGIASATGTPPSTDELVAVTAAQTSPYTTFQQLTFAPNFPLATIADDYVIPPTYVSFLDYRTRHEPEVNGEQVADLSQVQFSPPGLPVPTPAPPSKWFYKDPKGVVHGPWKTTLMQAWYKDGLLPPDLPVRREEDAEFILLRDLRLQCVDPTHPFRTSPPLPAPSVLQPPTDPSKPLLSPISLLSQPKHFGPPALFYSSRGGHSTTIVDARGRSVLKGRFMWSTDDSEDYPTMKLGDVKRLEAFDVQDRAVLVAMRQGGLEAVDFGDALLKPADCSRTIYPSFSPPVSSVNRRGPFVWKIGSPLSHGSSTSLPSFSAIPSSRFGGHRKKQSTGPSKSPGRSDFQISGDGDSIHPDDEILFLGRKEDELYICEKRSDSFRILKLSPLASS